MDIHLQGESKGIWYEGYTKAFRECVFEEGDVQGRNERYEFRCDADLECCGRTCCIPTDTTIPIWLMILFVILSLLLLLCILGTLAYMCAKRRKPKPKKDFSSEASKTGYTALVSEQNSRDGAARNLNRYLEHDAYSTPDNVYGGYGNRTYSHSGGSRGGYGGRDPYGRDAAREAIRDVRDMTRYEKFIPSPMSEENLGRPKPTQIVQHSDDTISRVMHPEHMETAPLNPQRAQMAFYRPFVADQMEETTMPAPLRQSVSYHSVASSPQMPTINPVDNPRGTNAERMYKRPGFDNVPSY